MKALSVPRAHAWAILTGHVRTYTAGGLPAWHGPLLIHAAEDIDPFAAEALVTVVAERSGVPAALLTNALALVRPGGIVGGLTVTGRFAAPPVDVSRQTTYVVADPWHAYPAVPCAGDGAVFEAPDAVLAALRINGYLEEVR